MEARAARISQKKAIRKTVSKLNPKNTHSMNNSLLQILRNSPELTWVSISYPYLVWHSNEKAELPEFVSAAGHLEINK